MHDKTENIFQRINKLIVNKILHIDDTPHRLALGIALGLLVGWTPTIGLQMIIAALLATIIRANIQASVIMVWVSNPLTMAIIYYPNYLVGRLIMRLFSNQNDLGAYSYQQLKDMLAQYHANGSFWSCFYNSTFWKNLLQLLIDLGAELWIGSLLIGLIVAIISYFASYRSIVWYREHTPMGRRFMQLLALRKKRLARRKARRTNESDQNPTRK